MSSQNFVRNLGFGPKGYSQLNSDIKFNTVVITGGSIDISKQHFRIQKLIGSDVPVLMIGNDRSSLKSIKKISNDLVKKEIDRLILIGGGSIIDYGKRIYINMIKARPKSNYELVAIPSRIGSGAESSMTSIVNTSSEKSIIVDSKFMPDTVIYDLELFNTLSPSELYLGSLDAITHFIESTNSFLSNSYVNFISNASLKRYLSNIYEHDFNKPSKKLFTELSLLSFNGGAAQNNAGAGLCHSLSHSAEKILNISHLKAISVFLKPSLDFMTKYHPDSFKTLDKELIKNVCDYINFYNPKILKNIETINLSEEDLKKIISTAPNDPCWKLMSQRVDQDKLFKYLKGNYETN